MKPDRSSATFTSVVGYSDIRVELDAQVKPNDDSRYYASLSLMAAKLVYENNAFISNIVKNHWNVSPINMNMHTKIDMNKSLIYHVKYYSID